MRRLWWCLLVFLSVSCGPKEKLRIAAAASMLGVVSEMTDLRQYPGMPVEITGQASGVLVAQIQQGAPFDLFLSADMAFPQALHDHGLTVGPPMRYAKGTLSIGTNTPGLTPDPSTMLDQRVGVITMPDPAISPYGKAAEQWLKSTGIWDSIQPKLVLARNVNQVMHFLHTGHAQIGITATSAFHYEFRQFEPRFETIDTTHYTPVAHGAVVIKGKNELVAQQVLDRLLSSKGHLSLVKNGLLVP